MTANLNNTYPIYWNRRLSTYLFSLPFGRFCSLIFLIVLLLNGVWVTPNVELHCEMSNNLTKNTLTDMPSAQYLYTSFFGLALGYLTGASKSLISFIGLHFLSLCLGFFILSFQIRKKFGDTVARVVVIAFACIPLCNVLTTWLGMSDVFVFIFGTTLAIFNNAFLVFVFAFLLGMSHLEQSLVIVTLLAFWRVMLVDTLNVSYKKTVVICSCMFGGVALAKIVLSMYFYIFDFNIQNSRISYALNVKLMTFFVNFFRNVGVTLFSLHNVFWLFIIAVSCIAWSKNRRLLYCIVLSNVACMAICFVVLDTTRVFTLVVWPTIVLMCLVVAKTKILSNDEMIDLSTNVFMASLIIPKLIVWDGHIHSSTILYDFLLLVRSIGFFDLANVFNGGLVTPFR